MNRKERRAAASAEGRPNGPTAGQAPLFAQALGHHQAGRLNEAIATYRQVLALHPTHIEALNNLGAALAGLQEWDGAVAAYRQALQFDPKLPELHNNLANSLREQGQINEAIAAYRNAIALKPSYAEAHTNLGVALADLREWEEATACHRRALRLNPRFPPAHNNLGAVLREQGQLDQAVAAYRQAITCDPNYAEAYMNLGIVLASVGNREQALQLYRRALQLRPTFADAYRNLGMLLTQLHRHDDAIAVLRHATAVVPNSAGVHISLGDALHATGRTSEAIGAYDRAVALQPDNLEALARRGYALLDLERFDDAARDFARLIALDPDYEYARGSLQYTRIRCCDWGDLDQGSAQIFTDVADGKRACLPFMFLTMADDPALQQKCAEAFHHHINPIARPPMTTRAAPDGDKLRIAYLSADFRHHAISYLMNELLERHDRSRFETIAISFGRQDDMSDRMKTVFGSFIDVRTRQDDDVAKLLSEQGVDIVVDLMGYTVGQRGGILARRPAPLQVNFLGYPGTIGAEHIDYIVADRWVIPEDCQPFFAEKIVYMPDAYQPTDSRREIGPPPTRDEAGLPAAGFVFCCFNSSHKITPTIFDIWMRLLKSVEGSILWLLEDNPVAAANLRQEAAARGIMPSRLVFAPRVTTLKHLARQQLADLFLDTLPYNAHTTASDALWAGLPIVTCPGASFPARVAASLLAAAGLPELVTHTLADYEALALRLAREPAQLAAVKATLAENRSTCALFDTDRYRRHLESAYETMWARHLRGEPPATFAVTPIDA